MTEPKWMPGPWSFDGPSNNIHVRLAGDPNMRVCFMTSDGPTRANARLIAASPDLYAACKALLERYLIMGCGEGIEARAAKLALAKADGTAPRSELGIEGD